MILEYIKAQAGEPRLERKYYVFDYQDYLLIPYLKLAPQGLREIYYQRQVNNIYFDTASLSFFQDNLTGAQERIKLRLRWYGDRPMIKPNLEIKMRQASLIYKLVLPFKPKLPEPLQMLMQKLKPSLHNSYLRQYFLTKNGKVRLTVDRQIQFEKKSSAKTVVELKYGAEDENQAISLINRFPLLLQKNSKYVDGVASRLI